MRKRLHEQSKKKKPRTKKARARRTLAIVLLVGGVTLETLANVVQLVESHTVDNALAQFDAVPAKVERWARRIVK